MKQQKKKNQLMQAYCNFMTLNTILVNMNIAQENQLFF